MRNTLLLILTISLVGCATPKYNYQATPQNVSKPPIGSTNEVFVGDKMLEQGVFIEREALFLPKIIKRTGYTFNEGYYLKTGEDKSGQYFQAVNMMLNGGNVQKSFIADPIRAVMLDVKSKLCVITVFNAKVCTDEHEAKISKIGIAADNSFQQTLIYSGKVGNKINIGYREFSSNIARPAFNNDVEYDLSDSKQIGYKGALLEIVDANNQKITYKVLKNFNKVD